MKIGYKPMIAPTKIVKLVALIVAIGNVALANLPGLPTPLDKKIILTITVRAEEQDTTWVTPQLRPQIINRLKEALPDQHWHNWGTAGLLALEDQDTIQSLFEKWRTTPDVGPDRQNALTMLVKYTPTAALLPLLAQHLDDTRIYEYGGGDLPGDVEWRQIASGGMIDAIYLRNEFPAATKRWARSLGREPLRHVQVKPWWEHNKDLILARRFSEATWLPTASNSVETNSNIAPSAPSVLPPPTTPSEPATQKQTNNPMPWLYVILIVAGILVLLWLRYMRRS